MLTLSGCGLISQATDALQGKTDVFSIAVGDCVNDGDLESAEVTSVEKPSCDEPHDNEVYLTVELDDSEYPADAAYPGEEAVVELSDASCVDYFETWVGASVDDTSLHYFAYYPSSTSWTQGDREVVCLAYDTEGKVNGSLEGKGPEFPYVEP